MQDKEERCRENFAANGMFMKMPRNPINGELTARDGAPYAIPFHHSIMLKMEESKVVVPEPRPVVKIAQYVDERDTTFARQNPLVEVVRHKIDTVKQPHLQTLRDKRAAMDNEISQMQRLAEYQRSMLLQSGGRAPHAVP